MTECNRGELKPKNTSWRAEPSPPDTLIGRPGSKYHAISFRHCVQDARVLGKVVVFNRKRTGLSKIGTPTA